MTEIIATYEEASGHLRSYSVRRGDACWSVRYECNGETHDFTPTQLMMLAAVAQLAAHLEAMREAPVSMAPMVAAEYNRIRSEKEAKRAAAEAAAALSAAAEEAQRAADQAAYHVLLAASSTLRGKRQPVQLDGDGAAMGYVFGYFAAVNRGPSQWQLTHVPSGRRAVSGHSKEDMRLVAFAMAARGEWSGKRPDAVAMNHGSAVCVAFINGRFAVIADMIRS